MMSEVAHPLALAPSAPRMLVDGLVSAQTMSWRHRGSLYASVVVKASFALRPDRRMIPRGLRSILAEPALRDHGVVYPSDCVPFRPQTDVVVVDPVHSAAARLRLVSGSRLLVDKTLGANSFAPVPPHAASRRDLAGGDVPRVGQAPLELSDDIDWACFQCAPPDQRTPALHGDEWLRLENMHAAHPTLWCQLPVEHGFVFVALPPSDGDDAVWAPLPLMQDLLAIDVTRMSAVISWRGYLPVADVDALARVRVVAGISAGAPPSPPPVRDIPSSSSTADGLAEVLSFTRAYAAARAPRELEVIAVATPPSSPSAKPFTWAPAPSEPAPAAIRTVSPRQPVPDVLDVVYRSFS